MSREDTASPQSKLREMLNENIALEPIECILQKIQLQLITGLEELAPPAYDFSELDKIFGKFQKNKMSTKSQYAYLILDIVVYFIKTMKNVIIKRQDYLRLEEETQDIEKKIREHIRIQNKLKLEFDIRDRMVHKMKEQNTKLRDDNKNLKITITNLQRKLHQQLSFLMAKRSKTMQSIKHFRPMKAQHNKINPRFIKDSEENASQVNQDHKIQDSNPHQTYPYQVEFSTLLQDIRRLENPDPREKYNRDRNRSLQ